ncbi:MAG: HEAT repeat domain-containing protein, partial [Planctomycetota bacterium]
MKHTPWIVILLLGVGTAGTSASDEYARRAGAIDPDDARAHYQLALWCQQEGLKAYALREHRIVVTLDPDHRAARRALGFEQVGGRWVRGRDAMKAKGFVQHKGVWMTREEYQLYAKDEIARQRAVAARAVADRALRRIRHHDERVRIRAMGEIERLEAAHRLRPLSIAARSGPADIRLRAVRGLGALDDARALPPLYKRAIFDPEAGIRRAAVAAIAATDAEGRIGPFARALDSPFSTVRVHAAEALGELGDARAVGPLVRRYRVGGG